MKSDNLIPIMMKLYLTKALSRKFARVDAQKSRINQTDCRSGMEGIRSSRVRWETNFDCQCLRTKSACPRKIPRMTTSWSSPWECSRRLSTPPRLVQPCDLPAAIRRCFQAPRTLDSSFPGESGSGRAATERPWPTLAKPTLAIIILTDFGQLWA